ncbi:MAG TPA: methyl-accepting chemotaxis protein [Myxococcales bacterium]|nr:methyl-accepting chemotaxis protein [Myxococcales bacterium]
MNLRWQVAIAILAPCAVLPIFSSFYFPSRMNAAAEKALELRASSLGTVAGASLGPTLGLIGLDLAKPEDMDHTLDGLQRLSDVPFAAVLKTDGESVLRSRGTVPQGPFQLPAEEMCAFDADNPLVLQMRCPLRDDTGARVGLLLTAFKRQDLLSAQEDNSVVGMLSFVLAVLAGLLLAFVFSRRLTEPVVQVTRAAREVAAGDVSVPHLKITAAGEIGSMANSFNEMLGNLRALVTQMVSLTGRLSAASQGLIGASTDQEHVTNQQAAYAQEIAATFEELSRTAEQIARSTEVVESAARRTNEAVEEAKAVFVEVSAGIANIRNESMAVADAITKLNQDLREVSKIAQVINQVAERSDLLALNAALEGTKAGEVGRGFSLVAAEMRKLAENVSASARDIGRIVETVQESGGEAVVKAQLGVAASDQGVKVAEQANAVFQRIVELARGTTEAAQQISTATRQQRQSSEQAVTGARNVADLVKQGVDATGRTTRIAQDLQSVARALAELTGKFKVDENRA